MSETENPLLVEHEAPLGWMIINRPHKRNSLNYQAWQRIIEAVEELNADPQVRVIIMRGVTPEAFISGADISEFPRRGSDWHIRSTASFRYRKSRGRPMRAIF